MAQKPKFRGGLITVSHCQPPLVHLLVSQTKHMLSANLRPCSNNYNNNLAPAQLSCTSRSLQERNTKHFQPAFHAIQMMSFIYKPPCIPVLLPQAPGCRHRGISPATTCLLQGLLTSTRSPIPWPYICHVRSHVTRKYFSPLDKTKEKAAACWNRAFLQATLPSQHREVAQLLFHSLKHL